LDAALDLLHSIKVKPTPLSGMSRPSSDSGMLQRLSLLAGANVRVVRGYLLPLRTASLQSRGAIALCQRRQRLLGSPLRAALGLRTIASTGVPAPTCQINDRATACARYVAPGRQSASYSSSQVLVMLLWQRHHSQLWLQKGPPKMAT